MTSPSTRLSPSLRMPWGRVLVLAAAAAVALSGCRGVADLPLPGGAATGADSYRVSAEFRDVLDLVPQASVKVDQVTVGTVEDVRLSGWTATVTLRLPKHVTLPDNAVAELKQTSLLGEKYVQLGPPSDQAPAGRLGEGDTIPLARTSRNPEVEEVLSAMSLLLNGGGVAQLKVIQSELGDALEGNEESVKSVLTQLDTFVAGLDEQKSEIVRAIDNLDRLSTRLAQRRGDIEATLEATPQGLKVLADQRQQLTRMLQALSRLGEVGTRVIVQSRADTAANLAALRPILDQLGAAGDDLPKSLQLLLTYPFPDSTLNGIKGDYTNLHVTADFDLSQLGGPSGGPGGGLGDGAPRLPVPTPSLPLPKPGAPVPNPSAPVPSPSPGDQLCPPICLSSSSEQSGTGGAHESWTTLYTGGTA